MSSVTFSTTAVLPARKATRLPLESTRLPLESTRLRLTVRGRRVLLAVAALPLAAGIAFAALSGGAALATSESGSASTFATVTVMPGDTLWAIAAEVAPSVDPRDVVAEISRLNQLQGGMLQVGQSIAIPAQYTR